MQATFDALFFATVGSMALVAALTFLVFTWTMRRRTTERPLRFWGTYIASIGGLMALIPFLILIMMWVHRVLRLPVILPRPANYWVFVVIFSFGWFWIIWSNYYIIHVGEGTPLEIVGQNVDPTRTLVTTGPYAYLRNPMAFGALVCVLPAIGFLLHSWAGLILFPFACAGTAVYERTWEEKGLEARFGRLYTDYRAAVPALWPKLWKPYARLRDR